MTEIPYTFIAGDTVSWTASADGYPATDNWTLKYRLSGDGQINITGVASGDNWDVTITAVDSAKVVPGVYSYVKWVEKGSGDTIERHTVASGRIEIEENLALASEPADRRSHAQRMVTLLEEAIEKLAENPKFEFSFNGRTYKQDNLKALRTELSSWKFILEQEKNSERLANGGRNKKILVSLAPTS